MKARSYKERMSILLRYHHTLWFIAILCILPVGHAEARVSKEALIPLMDNFLHRTQTPGMVVAVLEPESAKPLVVARGHENMENAVPMRPDAVLRYGSISKVFTALHAMQCIAEGKLAPETDIRPWFPELHLPLPVTVDQLIRHTSGLPELLAQPEIIANPANNWTVPELLAAISGKPLQFTPGSKQEYNNTGYLLLWLLLEKVDIPTEKWLLARKTALDMPSLRVADDTSIVPRKASGYSLTPEGALRLPILFSTTLALGAGNLEGTAADLTRLVPLLQDYGALPENPRAPVLPDGTPAIKHMPLGAYSYGWSQLNALALFDLGNGRAIIGKDGMFPGFAAQFLHDPQTRVTVVVLINQEQACAQAFIFGVDLLDAQRTARRNKP